MTAACTLSAMRPESPAASPSLDTMSEQLIDVLRQRDPDVARILAAEADRQATTIELIASENHVSAAVMHAMGNWMTNKYAEGYPGARYYGGCRFYDEVENLARARACELFGCGFANVQPHSGANANVAAFMALCAPGDTIMSLPIKSGGHLSHGLKPNFSGTFYNIVDYDLDPDTVLTEAEVQTFITNAAIDLFAGSSVSGSAISVLGHTHTISGDVTGSNTAKACQIAS